MQTIDAPLSSTVEGPNATSSEYDFVVLGTGEGAKYIAWTLAKEGHRVASIERKYIGGSCPNIACLPSKNDMRPIGLQCAETAKITCGGGIHPCNCR
jgi:pyruvate/2-oxoglutarate dehydrogenase complex dihydrolipoamide dehydrogenase (E3) component